MFMLFMEDKCMNNRIFQITPVFKHQEQAIRLETSHHSFIVASGSGSGKSLFPIQ